LRKYFSMAWLAARGLEYWGGEQLIGIHTLIKDTHTEKFGDEQHYFQRQSDEYDVNNW